MPVLFKLAISLAAFGILTGLASGMCGSNERRVGNVGFVVFLIGAATGVLGGLQIIWRL